jgi:hypothetical protein
MRATLPVEQVATAALRQKEQRASGSEAVLAHPGRAARRGNLSAPGDVACVESAPLRGSIPPAARHGSGLNDAADRDASSESTPGLRSAANADDAQALRALADELAVAAEREIRLDPLFGRVGPSAAKGILGATASPSGVSQLSRTYWLSGHARSSPNAGASSAPTRTTACRPDRSCRVTSSALSLVSRSGSAGTWSGSRPADRRLSWLVHERLNSDRARRLRASRPNP